MLRHLSMLLQWFRSKSYQCWFREYQQAYARECRNSTTGAPVARFDRHWNCWKAA